MAVPAHYFNPSKPRFELADIFRLYGEAYTRKHKLPAHYLKVMRDIVNCRTSALGGHLDECNNCGASRISYNSCRNRHCPKCQHSQRSNWVEARSSEVLPIEYFHVVFTLPDKINSLALFNPSLIYNLLFKAVSDTLLEFGRRHLGGDLGFTAVLHTWGQTLCQHIHLHCIVTGGALSQDRSQFRTCKRGFLFPTRALSLVFRGKFCDLLRNAFAQNLLKLPDGLSGLTPAIWFARLLALLYKHRFVVYAKLPFAGPHQVISYIGRYTHSIAISNYRIVDIDQGRVSFSYKDYRADGKAKTMTLDAFEFIRRFLLHVLPEGFVRIRHYGLLASTSKEANLQLCRQLLAEKLEQLHSNQPETQTPQHDTQADERCQVCGVGQWVRKCEIPPANGPPIREGFKSVA